MIRWVIVPLLLFSTSVGAVETADKSVERQWEVLVRQPWGAITRLFTKAPDFKTATNDVLTGYCMGQLGIASCIVKGPFLVNKSNVE